MKNTCLPICCFIILMLCSCNSGLLPNINPYEDCINDYLNEYNMVEYNEQEIPCGKSYLVLFEKFDLAIEGFFTGFSFLAVLAVFGSLVGISLGTIYQKRFCSDMDLISGTLIQYLGAFILCIIMSLCFETGDILWTNAFMITLAWQVFGLSIGAVLLLMTMIKQDALARVGSYFYLVPALVAIQAWYLFDETMNFISIIGVLLIVFAVAIASSKK